MEKYRKILNYATYLQPDAHIGEWRGGCDKNGVCTFPFIDYDKEVKDFISDFMTSGYADDNYTDVLEKHGWTDINRLVKAISAMTESEVLSCLTSVIRQERFCEGLIESRIKDGTLSLLLKKLEEFNV